MASVPSILFSQLEILIIPVFLLTGADVRVEQ